MLFLCNLPIDEELIDKEKTVYSENNKIAMLIATVIGMLIIIITAGIIIVANMKTPQNVSPYCLFIKNEGKTCKIHHIKHEGKSLKQLVISENEMVLHQKLFEEVSKGAYFDGKRLYKEDDALEILAMYDTYQKEKELLFEEYLAGTLDGERTVRYNFIIEEIADLDRTIDKLNIEPSEHNVLTRAELIEEIEDLKKQLDETKAAQLSTLSAGYVTQNALQTEEKEQTDEQEPSALKEVSQNQQVEVDALIYRAGSTRAIVIPSGIEKEATIKKSSLYQ